MKIGAGVQVLLKILLSGARGESIGITDERDF
jgi:hypothetical protein